MLVMGQTSAVRSSTSHAENADAGVYVLNRMNLRDRTIVRGVRDLHPLGRRTKPCNDLPGSTTTTSSSAANIFGNSASVSSGQANRYERRRETTPPPPPPGRPTSGRGVKKIKWPKYKRPKKNAEEKPPPELPRVNNKPITTITDRSEETESTDIKADTTITEQKIPQPVPILPSTTLDELDLPTFYRTGYRIQVPIEFDYTLPTSCNICHFCEDEDVYIRYDINAEFLNRQVMDSTSQCDDDDVFVSVLSVQNENVSHGNQVNQHENIKNGHEANSVDTDILTPSLEKKLEVNNPNLALHCKPKNI